MTTIQRQQTEQTKTRSIEEVRDEAVLAFWAKVAELYPTAESGDVDIGETIAFDEAAKSAITNWVTWNVPEKPN